MSDSLYRDYFPWPIAVIEPLEVPEAYCKTKEYISELGRLAAARLRAARDVLDIGNPVALPSREASLFPFTIEVRRSAAKERMIDVFERVDADTSVKMVVDPAGDDGHDAAPGADVELTGSGAECVLGYESGMFDHYLQSAAWIGSPYAAVLGAKRAGASASRNFGRIRFPNEGEGDVPAVALTVDQHCDLRCCGI